MISKDELIKWISQTPADTTFWIDEGGLTIENSIGGYFEIGGAPDDDDDEDDGYVDSAGISN